MSATATAVCVRDTPARSRAGGAAAQKTIRVVGAKRALADVTLFSPEELRTVLEALAQSSDPAERAPILAFEQLAASLKALRERSAGGGSLFSGPQGPESAGLPVMDEVALRQLLYSPAVVPAVATNAAGAAGPPARGGATAANAIRVRPGVRKPALVLNASAVASERRREPYRDVAVAAEQAVVVEGLALDPRRQGGLIVDVLAGGVYPGLRALANSGTFSAPVFSVVLAQLDPRRGPQLALGGSAADAVHPYSAGYVRALQAQLEAALTFHLSGAGAYLALVVALRLAFRPALPADGVSIASAVVRVPTRGIELSSRAALERFVARLAGVFSKSASSGQTVSAAPEEFVFALTALLDVYRVGALGAYYHALAEGDGSLGAQRFLERAAIARAEEDQLAALAREIFAEVARARHYASIIEDRLGTARLREIELTAAGGFSGAGPNDPRALLGPLSKREREIVTTEYANRRAEWEAQTSNRCPHVRLAFRLRAAKTSREALKLLQELSAYYKAPLAKRPRGRLGALPEPELEWIHCKSCGFRVICPHADELIRMEARALSYDAIRTRLMRYAAQDAERGPGGGELRTSYSYFCRICNERLAELVQEDRTAEILGAVGGLDGHVKKVIWIEAVSAAELVRFPAPVDPRQFASTAVDVCHPLLLLAEGNLLKRGYRATTKPRGAAPADDPFDDEEAVDPRTHLYITLFVYAYVLNLIRSSHDASKPASQRLGFEGVRPNAKTSAYAEKILLTVLKKHSGLISQIEDITPEFIADRFREAYRLLVGEKGPQELTAADEAKIVVNEVVAFSPPYHYAAIAARVFGVLPVERARTPPAARREFETVLGRSLPAFLEDRAASSNLELVQLLLGVRPLSRGSRRVAVEYPRGTDPLYIYGAPEVNFLQKMLRVPEAFKGQVDMGPFDGFASLAEAMPACLEHSIVEAAGGREAARRVARQEPEDVAAAQPPFHADAYQRSSPIFGNAESGLFLESYRLFTEYTVGVVDAGTMAAYRKRLDAARTRERGFLLFRLAAAVKNYRQFGFTVSRRFGLFRDPRPADRLNTRVSGPDAAPKVPLTYLYDENGFRHSWANPEAKNIYVYSALEGGGAVELTRPDLAGQILADYQAGRYAGPIHRRALLDVRCSVCRVLLSEIHALDPGKAEASLQALAEFNAFFAFYSSRCPAGNLHAFANKAASRACSKCGMQEALVFGHNAPKHAAAARAYYDQNFRRYREQRDVAAGAAKDFLAARAHDLADPAAEALKKHRGFAREWRFDYSQLVRAAELVSAPVGALETLGATEGREYPDVLGGTKAPPPPDSLNDPRLLAVDSDVRVFTTAYNRLRFVHHFPKTPLEVAAILEDTEVPLHEYEGLATKLPDAYNDYHAKRLALIQLRSPEDVLNFTIESLARMALAVANAGQPGQPDWVGRLGKEFAQRTLRAVIRSERLLAKPGPFNFKIFGEGDIGGGSLGGVDAPADDFGDAGEDVLDAIIAEGGEDGAYDPFSLDEVDVDADSPNLEPQ